MDSEAYTVMRTMGFVVGAALSMAAFLLVLDTGNGGSPEVVDQAVGNATAEELSGVVAAIAEQVDVVQAEAESKQAVIADPETVTAEADPQNTMEPIGPVQTQHAGVQTRLETNGSDGSESGHSGDSHTYLFWSPFRSEWAAQGFARRLSLATQVAVTVVHAGPGEYRAAFSYQDDSERRAQIERIETITGLSLE